MSRKPQVMSDRHLYHVYARSNNQEWFYLPLPQVWKIVLTMLEEVEQSYAARCFAFVLMNNHFHMILETPLRNLGAIMNYFMREVSKSIARQTNRINHIFGGTYRSTLIQDAHHLSHTYKYIYRNPVDAGIVPRVEEYPYSTLPWVLRGESYFFNLQDKNHPLCVQIPESFSERLSWLNSPYTLMELNLIKNALRRQEFQFSKQRSLRNCVSGLMSSKR